MYAKNQPTHPLAYLKQARSQQSRWFSNQVRKFSQGGPRVNRSKGSVSRISKAIQQRGAAPFASTLRPNLTGGALPRTAGGYSIGGVGKARHFSHTSGCQAQVVQNVNAGIRAFFLGGGKVKFDGVDKLTGEKRFKSISATQDQAYKHFAHPNTAVRGTSLEFKLSPTITALSPIFSKDEMSATSLETPDFLTTLSGDFARSLRSLSLILTDLQRLSSLGDLPISLIHTPSGPILSVRFPGCDADLVSRLCDEVGVSRGIVREDETWHEDKEVKMALLFPFAPTADADDDDAESMLSAGDYFERTNSLDNVARHERLDWRDILSQSQRSVRSGDEDEVSLEQATLHSPKFNIDSPSGYESLDDPYDGWSPASPQSAFPAGSNAASIIHDYEGLEGIYRFLQVCDESRR